MLSLLEGQPTEFGMLPSMHIVPPESGYPGFGAKVVLEQADHVQLCKPLDKESVSYTAVRDVIQEAMAAANGPS